MSKYQRNLKGWSSNGPDDWHGADGETIINDYLNKERGYYETQRPGIEERLSRLVEVVGMIADKSGVNLLELLDAHRLDDQYRVNPNPED